MDRFLLFMIHFCSYFGTCLIFFIKDVLLFSGTEWYEKKLQNYTDDIWNIWRNGIIDSLKNIPITLIICLYMPIKEISDLDSMTRIPIYIILVDLIFYISHRIFHAIPYLYKFHKEHHATKIIIAANGLDSHIIEHIFVNMASIFIPYIILGFSKSALYIYIAYASFSAASSHSGYKHSLLHNLHHKLNNVNYGTGLYIMDRIFDTIKK